jgi:hypothetical protein
MYGINWMNRLGISKTSLSSLLNSTLTQFLVSIFSTSPPEDAGESIEIDEVQ